MAVVVRGRIDASAVRRPTTDNRVARRTDARSDARQARHHGKPAAPQVITAADTRPLGRLGSVDRAARYAGQKPRMISTKSSRANTGSKRARTSTLTMPKVLAAKVLAAKADRMPRSTSGRRCAAVTRSRSVRVKA